MNRTLMLLTLSACSLFAGSLNAQKSASEECSIAVLDLAPLGIADAEAHIPKVITASLAKEVAARSGCKVLTQEEIAAVVDYEAQKKLCGNEEASCLAELGSAMGVERIVGGSLSKIGTTYTLQTRMVDIEKVEVQSRSELESEDASSLKKLVGQAASELLGQSSSTSVQTSKVEGQTNPLFFAGAGVAAAGVLVTTGGAIWHLLIEQTLADPTSLGDDKKSANEEFTLAAITTGSGVLLALTGGVLMFVGGLE